ncbi:restriction endonuclease subunit S [Aeromonas oralensis]|uniref:restriction endonuclease subunit S n=1 Tax=Aeromonas oralensis TaxID=3415010 RepID=UPI003F68E618
MAINLTSMRLEDCMDAIIDYRGKTPTKTTSGIPLITAKIIKNGRIQDATEFIAEDDYASWMRRGIPQSGDVVLTTEAPLGEVAQLDASKIALAQRVITLRGKKGLLDNDFLLYLLQSHDVQHQLDGRGTGSTVKGIKQSELKEVILSFPPITAQKRIAKHLKDIDNKITLSQKISQTLEQMAQTLFKSWFVDFDPVVDNALDAGFFEQELDLPDELLRRAEARKAVRAQVGFKPLPAATRQLFPAAFETCDEPSLGLGGWVPKGWSVSTTGDELTVKGGSTPSTANPEFWEGGHIHWTSPKDLSGSQEKVMLDTERKITTSGLNKITSGLLPVETVLMSSRAPIGYLTLTKIPLAINQGYIAIPSTKRLSQEYVLYWLSSSMEEIKGIAGGTTFAEISKKTFNNIPLLVPNNETIERFSAIAKSYLNKMELNVLERTALEHLRETLLPKLISGELSLEDVELTTQQGAA